MKRLLVVCLAAVVAGCASGARDDSRSRPEIPRSQQDSRPVPAPVDIGGAIAAAAERLVGSPYRFGGDGPVEFDCSGLVVYVHAQAGIKVPRTAAEQFLFAWPVPREGLRPGDVVFFSAAERKVTHVGIYSGNGVFVHAPQSGRPVEYADLDSDYYRVNFAGAGRLHGQR